MEIYKKVFVILICVVTIPTIFLLVGCNGKSALEEKMDIEFPMNEKGYPQSNIVMINNKSYPIEIVGIHTQTLKWILKFKLKWGRKVILLKLFFLNIFLLIIGVLGKRNI